MGLVLDSIKIPILYIRTAYVLLGPGNPNIGGFAEYKVSSGHYPCVRNNIPSNPITQSFSKGQAGNKPVGRNNG